ncbi:hypothetical protein [Vibrio sp. 10N.222.52.B7]|uniref:hypothetical protein n=1 Tax=Vibrio sp. 10N.222.52.B7 TaxID=3229629 RepID=UPI003552AA83
MIVKFFKGDHSSVTNGLEYLEGGTKRRKVAPELLSGNPETTRELLKQASRFAKAYTYGCLSFEEENIPTAQKQILMESFEKTLLAGLEPDQYDIVWIEHRDKDRLELNFHIVNMELTTGKALTPYVHSRDIKRIDAWKCIANDIYGFTDPNDPNKRRTFTFGDNPPPRQELMKQVDNYLFELAGEGELNNQEDVINALNAIDGVTVTRNTKSSISFKAEGHEKPIRLKGDLYGKSYRGIENLAEQQEQRLRAFHAERENRLADNRRALKSRLKTISEQRNIMYQKPKAIEPDPTNAVGAILIPERNDSGALPSNGIRNREVSTMPASGEVKDQPERAVLPNKVTKNQTEPNVKHNTNQHQKPAKWVYKILAELKQAIGKLAERARERKAEAGELREDYDTTKRNCDELDQLLKSSGWGPSIIKAQAFKGEPVSDPEPAPRQRPTQPVARPRNRM